LQDIIEMKIKKEKILKEIERQIKSIEDFIGEWRKLYSIVAQASKKGYTEKLEAQYYQLKIWLMEHYIFREHMYAPGSPDLVTTCLLNAITLHSVLSAPFGTGLEQFNQFHNHALFALKNYLGNLKEKLRVVNEASDEELTAITGVPKSSIFVGHSFAKKDSIVVDAVLNSLSILGINVVTGERPWARRISDKIKGRIDRCDLVLIVMTRRTKTNKGNYDTSGWLIDEKAYAVGQKKSLILMVENGVKNIGGLQGDLEKIRFERRTLHNAILKLQEVVKDSIYGSE